MTGPAKKNYSLKRCEAFILSFVFSCLGGFFSVSAELEDVYLWKGKHSLKDQKISIPQYLIITGYARPSPLFQKAEGFLIPPYLEGEECSVYSGIYFSKKVKGVFPPNTPLEVIEAFHVLKDPGLIEKLIIKILDFKGIGVKGGPVTYCLVRGPANREFILRETITYRPNFYRYNSPSAQRAANILSHFKGRDRKTKKVLLTFELTKEHNEKCGWGWPKGEEPKIPKPEEEIKVLMERAMQFMKTNSSLYTFENILSHSDQVEVDLGEKALAFLVLNSSPLRIKDISLAKGCKNCQNR